MSYQDAARALLRDTVLEAVAELVRDRGWADTSLAAVATRARVSRQTLYNEFGSRQGLAQATSCATSTWSCGRPPKTR